MSHLSAHVQAIDRARAYRPLHTSTERSTVHPTPLHQGSAKNHHPAAHIASKSVIETVIAPRPVHRAHTKSIPQPPRGKASWLPVHLWLGI